MKLSVEQKLDIHELLGRAAYAYDERDMAALQNCFSATAVMSMRIAGGDLIGPFEGRDAIMGLMSNSMAQQSDVRRHVVSNLTLVATENGTAALLAAGIYRDALVEEDGTWRIASRHVELDSPY